MRAGTPGSPFKGELWQIVEAEPRRYPVSSVISIPTALPAPCMLLPFGQPPFSTTTISELPEGIGTVIAGQLMALLAPVVQFVPGVMTVDTLG